MIWRKLLAPLAAMYWVVSGLRNIFYSIGMFPSKKFNKAVIVVGNLNTGGTGKSPHTLYLLNFLRQEFKVGMLSRGYGRKTKGFQIANYESNARTIGDEPMQVFNRFKNRVVVAVGEDRISALKEIFRLFRLDVVVLDDAYQHRRLKTDFNLLLTAFDDPYHKDWPLPMGNLREPIAGASRASAVIVTKCQPDLSMEDKIKFRKDLRLKNHQHIFFSSIIYNDEVISLHQNLSVADLKDYNVILVTGIANDKDFLSFAENHCASVQPMHYPDHYNFSPEDIQQIDEAYANLPEPRLILTTEKDYMRLRSEHRIVQKLYYLPIQIEIDNPIQFQKLVKDYVQKY